MDMPHPAGEDQGVIHHISVNQDASCLCVASSMGVIVFSLSQRKRVWAADLGAMSVAEMLFCTSLLALVGAGSSAVLSPRWLRLWDTASNSVVKELGFTTRVLAVAMNKRRLVVLLGRQACVYDLPSMELIQALDCPPPLPDAGDGVVCRQAGVMALTKGCCPSLLALPSGPANTGVLRVYHLGGGAGSAPADCFSPAHSSHPVAPATAPDPPGHSAGHGSGCSDEGQAVPSFQPASGRAQWSGGPPTTPGNAGAPPPTGSAGDRPFLGCRVLCEVAAHKSPLALLCWSADGQLLASASRKGTVIRVTRVPGAVREFSCRRGSMPTVITSLCFSPLGMEPPLLAVTSLRGTCHVFRLEEPGAARSQQPTHSLLGQASAAASLAAGGAGVSAAAAGVSAAVGLVAHGLITTVSLVPAVHDMVEPSRSIAAIKLRCHGVAACCAVLPARPPQGPADVEHADGGTGAQGVAVPGRPGLNMIFDPSAISLMVATLQGILYEFNVEDLRNPAGARCSLQGEWQLLPPRRPPAAPGHMQGVQSQWNLTPEGANGPGGMSPGR